MWRMQAHFQGGCDQAESGKAPSDIGSSEGRNVQEAGRLALPLGHRCLLPYWSFDQRGEIFSLCPSSSPFPAFPLLCLGLTGGADSWAHPQAEIGPESFPIWPDGRDLFCLYCLFPHCASWVNCSRKWVGLRWSPPWCTAVKMKSF